jgi:hypothetical protein
MALLRSDFVAPDFACATYSMYASALNPATPSQNPK